MSTRRDRVLLACLLGALCAGGCAGAADPTGTVSVPLAALGASGTTYRLHGTVQIDGPTTVALSADGDTLESELPIGSYTLTLEDGWTVSEVAADATEHVVDSALISQNPTPFVLEDGKITWVRLQFKIGAKTIQLGFGDLHVGIDVNDGLIDDFEDGDGIILSVAGRHGSWFTTNDGTGTQNPVTDIIAAPQPGGADGGLVMRTTGSGFTDWGASLVVTLNDFQPYDASQYTGVRFKYKSTTSLQFDIHTATCVDACAYSVALDGTAGGWTTVELAWSAFTQAAAGLPPFTPNAINLLDWRITIDEQPFDISVDDVELVP